MTGQETHPDLDDLLADFPADWDLKLFVCCRGETLHGPLGVRRWSAIAITRMWTHEEIMEGDLTPRKRLQTACWGTPGEAVRDAVRRISAGEYDSLDAPDSD